MYLYLVCLVPYFLWHLTSMARYKYILAILPLVSHIELMTKRICWVSVCVHKCQRGISQVSGVFISLSIARFSRPATHHHTTKRGKPSAHIYARAHLFFALAPPNQPFTLTQTGQRSARAYARACDNKPNNEITNIIL